MLRSKKANTARCFLVRMSFSAPARIPSKIFTIPPGQEIPSPAVLPVTSPLMWKVRARSKLSGKVIQVLESPDGPHPLCKPCQGERKDQPVEGMTILWGAKRRGVSWGDGKILDPENGKIYRVTLTPLDGGEKLNVRGYIGVP